MKTFNYIFAILAAGALLASCGEKEDAYVWGEEENANCYGITFPDQTVCDYELDPEDPAASVVTINAHRAVTTGDITVPVTIRQWPYDDEYVFAHTDLKFADGESDASFQVSFTNAEIGKEYECHITIEDPQYASLYKKEVNFISFKFMKVSWETLAVGTLDSWWAEEEIPDVTLQHCLTFPDRYRLVDPYGYGSDVVFTTTGEAKTDKDGGTYYNVRVAPTFSGYTHSSYGAVYYQDYAYATASDDNIKYCYIYPDYAVVQLTLNWYVSAGSFGTGYESFAPASGE